MNNKKSIKFKVINWFARIIGFLACAFFLMFFIGEGGSEFINEGIPKELIPHIITVGICIIGYILSWFNKTKGGILLSLGAIASGIFLIIKGGSSDLGAALIYCIPFLIPGALFIACGLKEA